jgi:acetyltransferase-like isoleucine patch superfamily enzyme
MKKLVSNSIYWVLAALGGEAFGNKLYSKKKLFKHFILQKILRMNGHVPWPVHPSSFIKSPDKIVRGTRNPGMAPWCYIDGRNGIIIGENTWIGPRVSIISMDHDITNYPKYIESKPIKIGANCWIATGAIITAGVELGDHTVVAAGSVVTKSFPGNCMIGGVPAKIIKSLEDYNGA